MDRYGYHGIFRFYSSVDDEWGRCEAKFTDGELVQLIRESQESHRDRRWLVEEDCILTSFVGFLVADVARPWILFAMA